MNKNILKKIKLIKYALCKMPYNQQINLTAVPGRRNFVKSKLESFSIGQKQPNFPISPPGLTNWHDLNPLSSAIKG